jgi:hypothetical protein
MIVRFTLAAGVLLALVACGPSKAPEAKSPPAAKARKGPPPPFVVTPGGANDYFRAYQAGPLALDEYAVGPIIAQTVFSLDALKPRFPKAQVKAAFLHEGAEAPTPIITVEQAGATMLEIQGNPGSGTVGDIRVTGGTPLGPRGETLGMKWADADLDLTRCWMGKGRDVHAVICTQRGEPVLRYVFGVPGWTQDALPPEAVLRDKGFLREFLWRGGAPVGPPAVP